MPCFYSKCFELNWACDMHGRFITKKHAFLSVRYCIRCIATQPENILIILCKCNIFAKPPKINCIVGLIIDEQLLLRVSIVALQV